VSLPTRPDGNGMASFGTVVLSAVVLWLGSYLILWFLGSHKNGQQAFPKRRSIVHSLQKIIILFVSKIHPKPKGVGSSFTINISCKQIRVLVSEFIVF